MVVFLICVFFIAFLILRKWLIRKRCSYKLNTDGRLVVGFFHPYCNAGGGGERVLWASVKTLMNKYDNIKCVIYTGDVNVPGEEILKKAESLLKITLPSDIQFVYLKHRYLVEAKLYPYFTLLFQSLASMLLGLEALFQFVPPDIFIDTMGYSFTLPIFKYLASCQTACYVHYPTISMDMLEAVTSRRIGVNNRRFISNSSFFSALKVYYYKAFAKLYGLMGRRSDIVMVNSTWTKNHILKLWAVPSRTFLVYPPCDVSEFENIPISTTKQQHRILSISQFRPEKNHELQIRAFCKFLSSIADHEEKQVVLVLIGGCRSDEDWKRVEKLKTICKDLGIEKSVQFKVNLPFAKLMTEMGNAEMALHTMWNEHFGIGVVECMSAGLITIAHNSGGPKLDIVTEFNGQETGFLAECEDSYCSAMKKVLQMSDEQKLRLIETARASARRFSVQNFNTAFLEATECLFL